eukprot:CAMPEP_0197912432 /NCGR_PEP_ID=MMETSP1439-20131203/74743_1 /TAXON_ID=66791 /ORGANISM="Gonyaulax spinifera, Strain CCMP409" /LENGTH=161 /DNA_ID=CAMNT_0043534211 /DNA_START=81 /DNA_END=566 /DNA_ORIENTATION=+
MEKEEGTQSFVSNHTSLSPGGAGSSFCLSELGKEVEDLSVSGARASSSKDASKGHGAEVEPGQASLLSCEMEKAPRDSFFSAVELQTEVPASGDTERPPATAFLVLHEPSSDKAWDTRVNVPERPDSIGTESSYRPRNISMQIGKLRQSSAAQGPRGSDGR